MKLLKKTIAQYVNYELQDVVCNKCGNSCTVNWTGDLGQHFDFTFGYNSSHDGENYEFDLCEKCIFEMFKTFKIEPNGDKYLP